MEAEETFEDFFGRAEPRLRQSMTAMFGPDDGRAAALDALAYAWEHWPRVSTMDNPIGYLYVVARDRQRKQLQRRGRRVALPPVDRDRSPWVEPDLAPALQELPEKQRTVVMLLHCYEWTMSEVAELLGISKATVQTHADRGMQRLRTRIGAAS